MSACRFDPAALPRESPHLRQAIQQAPKCELHIHLEGTLEPELAFELAARNGVVLPYASVEDLKAAYSFDSLQSFLDVYYSLAPVLVTEADFRDLALAYLRRAAADGIVHAEVFFDPQSHTCRGIDIGAVMRGLAAARTKAAHELGISVNYIMCFLRHQDEDKALATLEAAKPYLGEAGVGGGGCGIIGVGLDSSEQGNPPEKFARAFEAARSLDLRPVAHAGEEGPPEYIWSALDTLKVQRVDHGVAAVKDARLLERLARERIPLTVCPLSNVKLAVYPDMTAHPLLALLDAGVVATVNSDDPAFFGGYLCDNFAAMLHPTTGIPGLRAGHVWRLLRNSVEASFMGEKDKERHAARIDEVFRSAVAAAAAATATSGAGKAAASSVSSGADVGSTDGKVSAAPAGSV